VTFSPDEAANIGAPDEQLRLAASTVRLGTQALVLLLGNAFTLCVGLPLQIYVARVLGAADLGVFALFEAVTGLLAGLLSFGIAPTVVRFIPQHLEKCEFRSIKQLLRRGAAILGIGGAIGYVGMLLFVPISSPWRPELAPYRSVIDVMAWLTPFGLLIFFLQQGLRGFQEIRYVVIGSSFLQLTVKALLTVALLTLGFGLFGYATAVVVSTFMAGVWMLVGLWRKVTALPQSIEPNIEANAATWRSYAMVMYSNSLLGLVAGRLDRFVLALFFGPSPVGVWSVVTQLYLLPNVILNMLIAAAVPMFSAAHAREDSAERQHLFHLVTDWSVRAALPLILFFLIFGDLLLRLYGEEFAESGKYALWIMSGAQAINLAFGPLGYMLNMTGLERAALRLAAFQAVLTVAGFVTLVPLWGLNGAAITGAGAILFINIAELVVARRRLALKWWSPRYTKWLLSAVIASASAVAFRIIVPMRQGVLELAIEFLLIYAIFHLVSLAQGLNQDDRVLLTHARARLSRIKQA
jgi:O-antigen/teichoic acid export membrane protein